MQPWRIVSKVQDCFSDSEDVSQLMISVYVQQKPMPSRGLSRSSRRILLTTSIWSVIVLVLAFFITYAILLVYVNQPFQKAHSKQDMIPRMSQHYGRPKVKFLGRGLALRNESFLQLSSELSQRKRIWNPGQFDDLSSKAPKCRQGTLFVIIVTSSPDHFEHRTAIRNTWCNFKMSGYDNTWQCLFLIGQTNDTDISSKISRESLSYRDIIRGSYVDSYRNLTCKVMHGFAWLSRNCKVPYVLKTDDDCFVNALLFRQFLLLHNTQTTNLYAGNMVTNKDKRKVIRKPNEKWFVSVDDYLPEYYPVYASGTGYALSFDVVTKLVEESRFNKPIANEDAYVGIVLDGLRMQLTLSGRFTVSSAGLRPCNFAYIFVAHGVEPGKQEEMQSQTVAAQSQCNNEEEITGWF